ncbi:zinc finger CCCH domain-containing protein 11-like isoform X2 [Musa acuminata AAA Group]|uniref:zinc finger CCCH domain-containing protein 11-like isoform X2 n=1 Tax=Musa acuminata AAA Group TaxID=214697 RepID=UPI0031D21708
MCRREFREAGRCQKVSDCKFSHDLYAQWKGVRIDLYSDQRGQGKRKKEEEREAGFAAMSAEQANNDWISCGNSLIPSDSSDVEAHEKYAREEPFTEEGSHRPRV